MFLVGLQMGSILYHGLVQKLYRFDQLILSPNSKTYLQYCIFQKIINYSKQGVNNLNLMSTTFTHPIKMLDFIENLYKRYKILNKISEKQSLQFQKQVITLLVDSKQNVDSSTLNQLLDRMNLEGFILDILSKVINRSPFKNQFELNRNLASITQNVKKQQEEIQRKQKILQRKQEKIKNTEDSIMANLKQKIMVLENQSLQKIIKKENQIKKNITLLMNQLKTKEKIIIQKYQAIKSNTQILAQIEIKEKSINEKLRLIEKKEKQLKTKDNQNQILKKTNQLNLLKQNVQKLKQSLKESNKRYKNLQMAYKKLKNTKNQQQESQKKIQNIPKIQIAENKHQLDKLQLSDIHETQKNSNYKDLINYIQFQQANTKIEQIKRVFVLSNDKNSQIHQLKQIKQLLNIPPKPFLQSPSQSMSQEEEEQDQSIEKQQTMPPCLQPIKQPVHNDTDSLVKRIQTICLDEDSDKLSFIQQDKLSALIALSSQLNNPQRVCEILLQKILQLIQQSPHYLQIIQYLSSANITDYLQHIYLCHQTNPDIIETATLILSRIKLKDYVIKLKTSFMKALQIRLKIENKNSFLYGNIHFLLN